MTRLLSIEFYKLIHNRASKIITLIYFGLLTSMVLLSAVKFNIGPFQINLADQGIFEFPFIWHFSVYIAGFLKVFLLILIVSMVSNEYSNKTLKQNLIDGLSKKEYILSKFYMAVAMALASAIFILITALMLGLLHSGDTSLKAITSELYFIPVYFIKLVAFFSFGLFMGVLIKRSAFALGGMFVWYIVEKIIFVTVMINYSGEQANQIAKILPLMALEKLIPAPFTRMQAVQEISKQMGETALADYTIPVTALMSSILWTMIFVYGAYALIKKRDL